jgi:soluble lytic murein transglycosylase
MKRILWILLLGFWLLSACNLPKPTPPTPTVTVGPSVTPTATVTPMPTATPLFTPTPQPGGRIGAGDKALANGDYFQAIQEYQAALASSSDDLVRAAALWGLGKTNFLYENYPQALENLRQLVQAYSQSAHTARAYFLLGETYFTLKRYQEAADAYAKYLEMRPGILDTYVQEQRGDAFFALANYAEALKIYQAVLPASDQANPTGIKIKIANATFNGGDLTGALAQYDEIYNVTGNDYVKAQMDLMAGRALIALGRSSEGYDRWRHAVENFPLAYDSYSALVGLVDANQPVDDYHRGLVDYFAGKYGAALAAFDRYVAANPDHDGTTLRYRALMLREMGDYQAAIAAWDSLIANYPNNRYWAAAWGDKALTQWAYLNQYTEAAKTLQDYAKTAALSQFTVNYLMEAGRIYERDSKLEEAAALWEGLSDKYPSDSAVVDAFFLAGIVRFRQGKYPQALQDFQRNLVLVTEPTARARALLWVGKTYQASNDATNAANAWREAQALDATGYYSVRARDLLNGTAPFAAPSSIKTDYDLNAEQTEAAAWVRVKFNLPPETNLSDPGMLAADPRLQRGTEYWQLGLFRQARTEFEDLRAAVSTNPADSFRLGNYLLALGAYRPAIFAIREVLTLAGLDDHSESLGTPAYFKRVRYGLYFADMIWPAAAENDLDPLFVTSLVRQESLFEGFAGSSAGARGLMQIMPSTGASIAAQMGWPPDYSENDLYSPYISLRMGTFYLDANRRLLNGDMYAALAAYNGGPGNAQSWQELSKGDQDLQLEIIRFYETRDYVRSIYETYSIYRSIYSPVQ